MTADVSAFDFDGQQVRTITIDGEPWFVAKDVAVTLGYVDPANAIKQHAKGVANHHPLPTAGGPQQVRVLSEPDVLRLIVSSKLPAAERFERWVFEEVLPAIRRTGSYSAAPALTEQEIVARALQITSAQVTALEAKVAEDAPKVEYVDRFVAVEDDVILVTVAAAQIGMKESELRSALVDARWITRKKIGQHFSPKRGAVVDDFEYRASADHREHFALRPQHNAPRFHNGQVRQTLYIRSTAMPAIERLVRRPTPLVSDVVTFDDFDL